MSQSEQYPVHPGGSDVNPARYAKRSAIFLGIAFFSAVGAIVAFFLHSSLSIVLAATFFIGLLSFGISDLIYGYKRYGWGGIFDENEATRVAHRNAIQDVLGEIPKERKT